MILLRRRKVAPIPQVGDKSPKFQLPSAQGGQLRLDMRTARGPVVVVFYRPWSEEDVEYFRALAGKEEEINLAAGSVVSIGIAEPDATREFVRKSGIKSYVLYDYTQDATREWGLLEKDKEHGPYARPAVFIVSSDNEIVHAWVDERPQPEEILAKVSEITGLPKPPEEGEEEKPKKQKRAERSGGDETEKAEKPKKLSPEEREKRRAERKAAREARNKPEAPGQEGSSEESGGSEEKAEE